MESNLLWDVIDISRVKVESLEIIFWISLVIFQWNSVEDAIDISVSDTLKYLWQFLTGNTIPDIDSH